MDDATIITLLALGISSVPFAAYWAIAMGRIVQGVRSGPSIRDHADDPAPSDAPGVCVVVPAHNERDAIPTLVRSLRRQDYPDLRVVLALDRCTDDTRETAQRAIEEPLADANPGVRFEIVEITECPQDWAGKTHAAWAATRRAAGAQGAPLLLFADADTAFDPCCVRASVALLRSRGLGLLSLLSTLTSRRWFERVAQPMAAFELMRQYPIQSANDWPAPRPFANGQFMLFTREVYDAIGGHESVKFELLEDIALARRVKKIGFRPGLAMTDGLFTCDMYEDWGAFVRGWKRIFTEAGNRHIERLRTRALRMWLTDALAPVVLALAFVYGVVVLATTPAIMVPLLVALAGGAGLAAWLVAMSLILRTQHAPLWGVLLTPVGGILAGRILRAAARDLEQGRGAAWGGRVYRRVGRKDKTSKKQHSAGAIGDAPAPDAR